MEELKNDITKRIEKIEEIVGRKLKKKELLVDAISHPSSGFQKRSENPERLEFLGDAVLQLSISYALFRRFPELSEGGLTKLRASLVNKLALSEMARELGIDSLVILGKGEENSGGREKPSILSDTFERILGAVFLDLGFEETCHVVERLFEKLIEDKINSDFLDAKSALQELTQRLYGKAPAYSVLSESGPPHSKKFTVKVKVGESEFTAEGHSKKEAEKKAAEKALKAMREEICQE